MTSKTRNILIYLSIMLFAKWASASTWYVNGKEVTRGEALIALARDSKVKVTKVDVMEISDKGTLKAVKTASK